MSRVVHLELHTHDRAGASAFYRELLQWRTEQIDSRWGTYHALVLGDTLDGGIIECGTCQPGWLPYVEVDGIEARAVRVTRSDVTFAHRTRRTPA